MIPYFAILIIHEQSSCIKSREYTMHTSNFYSNILFHTQLLVTEFLKSARGASLNLMQIFIPHVKLGL